MSLRSVANSRGFVSTSAPFSSALLLALLAIADEVLEESKRHAGNLLLSHSPVVEADAEYRQLVVVSLDRACPEGKEGASALHGICDSFIR
jgi:hypothetical protein